MNKKVKKLLLLAGGLALVVYFTWKFLVFLAVVALLGAAANMGSGKGDTARAAREADMDFRRQVMWRRRQGLTK